MDNNDIKLTKEQAVCHDCGKKLKNGDKCMLYNTGEEAFVKCVKCHKADPLLRNYQDCEVYSRIVGYIRPVQQWNKGKREEFQDRVNYKPA